MRCACGARAVRVRCLCLHAIGRVGHASLFETEAFHVGSAPGGDQQHVALELAHLAAAAAAAAAARDAHAHPPPLEGGHLLDLYAQLEGHAVGCERRVHRRRRVGVRARQQPRAALDTRDLAPEGGEGLSHLKGNGAAAEHHQPLGQRGQVV